MNKGNKHAHPYLTRSKAKEPYTISDHERKGVAAKQIVDPYISYSDGIKLYMNRGISDNSYTSAEYEDDMYVNQTSEEHQPKKRKARKGQSNVVEKITKIAEKAPDDNDNDILLDEYVLI